MCLFKVTISGTRKLCKIYSKLTAKTLGVCQEYLSAIVLNSKDLTCFFFFEHTSLTLPRQKFILVFTNFFFREWTYKAFLCSLPSTSFLPGIFVYFQHRSFYLGIIINLFFINICCRSWQNFMNLSKRVFKILSITSCRKDKEIKNSNHCKFQ